MTALPDHAPRTGLRVGSSHLWQTRSTRVDTPRGVVLFDPCYFPAEIDTILVDAKACSRKPGPPSERVVVFTHSDWDHVVAAPRLKGWRRVAHRLVADKPAADRRRIVGEIEALDRRWYVPRAAWAYPEIDHAVGDDETLELAGEPVRVVHTPGHTDDAVVTVLLDRGVVVAGDFLSALEFPFVYHGVAAYRRSLDRVAGLLDEHHVETLIPGHGPVARGRAEIDRRLDDDRRYLDDLASAASRVAGDPADAGAAREVASSVGFRGSAVAAAQHEFHLENARLALRERSG